MDTGNVSELYEPIPAAPRRVPNSWAHWTLWRVMIIAACLLIAALLACAAIARVVASVVQAQQTQIEPVIDEFMTAMAARDTDRAYGLFSDHSQKYLSKADLKRMVQGNGFMLFDGYQRVALVVSTVGFNSDTDATAPQGLVARVSGSITYSDGLMGSLEATLEREGDTWRPYAIDINVPPEKFDASTS